MRREGRKTSHGAHGGTGDTEEYGWILNEKYINDIRIADVSRGREFVFKGQAPRRCQEDSFELARRPLRKPEAFAPLDAYREFYLGYNISTWFDLHRYAVHFVVGARSSS